VYAVLLLGHVLAASLWASGVLTYLAYPDLASPRFLTLSGLATLALGLALTLDGGFRLAETWLLAALATFYLCYLAGLLFVRPDGQRQRLLLSLLLAAGVALALDMLVKPGA
jgi:hypothetical protein